MPRGELPCPRSYCDLAERSLDCKPQHARSDEPPRHANAGAGPVESGGVLVHVTDCGAGDDGAAGAERAHERAVAGVADDDIAVGHGARVGDPVDDAGVIWHGQWAGWQTPVVGGEDAHWCVGEAAQGGAQHGVLGVLGGGGGDEHERVLTWRQLNVFGGGLPHERPDDMRVGSPLVCAARVLELREGGYERELAADAPVYMGERRQSHLRARLVELDAPALQALVNDLVGATPEGASGSGARHARAERVDGETARAVGMDMRDEGGARSPIELGGEGGGEREDVVDDDMGLHVAHERERVAGGARDGGVEVERWRAGIAGGEDAILGGGGEGEPLGFDLVLPALPGLQRDVVSARGKGTPEGDHGEGVAGVAEGAEQHSQGLTGGGVHGGLVRRRARRAAVAAAGARGR